MDQYELGVAMAVSHLAERRRHVDRRRLARRIPGRTAGRRGYHAPGSPWVPVQHGQALTVRAVAAPPRAYRRGPTTTAAPRVEPDTTP
jgi:hypothetical protein